MYTRGRATPTNPNTPAQQAARNALSTLSTAWQNALTVAQRGAWDQYAFNTPLSDAFGEPLTLTGQQMYNRCNSPRVRAGIARVDDGPATFGQADLSILTIDFNVTPEEVELGYGTTDEWRNVTGGFLLVQTSQIVKPTINFLKGPFRFATAVVGDTAAPPFGPLTMPANAFGMTYADYRSNRVFYRVRASNADGRLSPVQILTVDLD